MNRIERLFELIATNTNLRSHHQQSQLLILKILLTP